MILRLVDCNFLARPISARAVPPARRENERNEQRKKEKMEDWYKYSVEDLQASAQNIDSLLKLPLVEDIMLTMETKLKLKSRRNSILSKIPKEEHDMVLGFLIGNPGLMTRRYVKFINTSYEQRCPYCNKENGNLIFHQFKCEQLFKDVFV